ncbi:MAG: aspartyl/glutamyl-tRNA(Asn/Gln) amidotransferase subunit B [Isosphaeraceae bacterium]|jgi:aspartyl-tRNA(Asn)/glutamyl-tRNA(Gln) amidotransferase subunit B|nr:MAG: aspartyl/glutamyl-tRNA(Asn/Gln) amidotransferase subunit B [Isosphaeraceae bacterium]
MDYTLIIGLEIHVQLQTESKMFSASGTDFGLPPNTQTDPVSLGLPGTLPVMNRRAFELALKTAVALNAEIAPFTKWDRKNYYYPDLPKNYQISQYDLPFSRGGWLEVPPRKDGTGGGRCRLVRVHLEEDTGKLIHGNGGWSEVDLNRAGIPLLEIVTEPDLRSAQDARACLEELRLTLRYLGVSDCEMQEGSLRCDANVNIHIEREGKTIATPIVEIKNLNSFRSVERAIEYEGQRQYRAWLADGLTIKDAPKQTRGWDDEEGVTKPQREKETAADYRYFPEPDLVPVVVDAAWLERVRGSIGELPRARRERFEREHQLSAYDAGVLVEQGKEVADYYEAVGEALLARDGSAPGEVRKLAANWVTQDVLRIAKERKLEIGQFPVAAEVLAELLHRVRTRQVNTNQGREILSKLVEGEGTLEAIIAAGGYGMVTDRGALAKTIEEILAANPKALEDLKNGKKKPEAVKGWLRGQVMKATGGKADAVLVGELLEARLASEPGGSG